MPAPLTDLEKLPVDPAQGYGFREQPRPEYLRTLDDVIARVNDPRNAMFAVGMPWLYHGTKARAAADIIRRGFDPARIGENWSAAFGPMGGRSGPGVYLSPTPDKALGWSLASGAEKPGLVRVFIPKKAILDTGADVTKSTWGRAKIAELAKQQGYKAVKFPDEYVIPDPTSIPLRNIRAFPGPSQTEQDAAQLYKSFGFGD